MKSLDIKKLVVASALGIIALLGTSTIANGQSREERRQARIEAERVRAEQQRQAEWERRNNRIVVRRQNGTGYYTLQTNGRAKQEGP